LIYTTEKSIKEAGDKVDEATKQNVQQAIERLKGAMGSEDAQEIKRLTDELTQASHKLAEAMYARASRQQGQAGGAPGGGGGTGKDEDVVDADFEEVKK
jgi:molecular chaperone DnaK